MSRSKTLNSGSPCIVVLTAPSGSGKTTIARRLLAEIPEMTFSVSATTREKRPGEIEGVSYHFLTREQFDQALIDGELLEYEEVYPGCWYGTLRREVLDSSPIQPVLLDVDVVGALNVKEAFRDSVLAIFIRPPSIDVLEDRLKERKTESDASLRQRLIRARKELSYENRFDVTVVNDDLEQAVRETITLVRAFLTQQRT